jgi:hypothetical protein
MLGWSDPLYVRRLVCFVTCIGLSVSSLEWLVPASKLTPAGLLATGGFGATRTIAERLWRPYGLRLVLALRLACAAAFPTSLLLGSHVPEAGTAVFIAGLLCLPLRLRGPVGVLRGMDGAEHLMTSTLLVLGATYILESALVLEAALVFVAAQALLEYASAGWTKLRGWRGWASGAYLRQVLSSSNYGHPRFAQLLTAHPKLGRILSIGVIAIEIVVPSAIVLPAPLAEFLLLAALTFHLATAVIMGLNTFVWAFPATYPAVLHCRGLLLSR